MRVFARGLLAGVVGAGFLSWFEKWEQRVLGRVPLYHPAPIADRLLSTWARRRGTATATRRLGLALRWIYGPALGASYAALRERLPRSRLGAGLALGLGILLLERVVLPATRATIPWPLWPRAERALLLMHTVAFGLATAAAERVLRTTRAAGV